MSILRWFREKIVGVADPIIFLDEMAIYDEFSLFPESMLVVIGSPTPAPTASELLNELIEEEVKNLSRSPKRWTPETVRSRLQALKQEEQDRLKSQKVTEWFMLAMYHSWIDHPEMAEYCLFEAQIEADVIKLQ